MYIILLEKDSSHHATTVIDKMEQIVNNLREQKQHCTVLIVWEGFSLIHMKRKNIYKTS